MPGGVPQGIFNKKTMSIPNTTSSAPLFYFNGFGIEASYSFSTYEDRAAKKAKSNKVWLDMVFTHPVKEEPVTVRAAKSAMILNQPREVIEAIALRDVREFLSASL